MSPPTATQAGVPDGTKVHADLSLPASAVVGELEWLPSPIPAIQRRLLDRDGGEKARATTVVQYDPSSKFPYHTHSGGEEFLVLAGTFVDPLSGSQTDGFYVRNPIGSGHEPYTIDDGCTILVKLRQMTDTNETEHTVVDTNQWYEENGDKSRAANRLELHWNPKTMERVAVEWWQAGTSNALRDFEGAGQGGVEVFVIKGGMEFMGKSYPAWSWIRFPGNHKDLAESLKATAETKLWVKTGLLPPAQ